MLSLFWKFIFANHFSFLVSVNAIRHIAISYWYTFFGFLVASTQKTTLQYWGTAWAFWFFKDFFLFSLCTLALLSYFDYLFKRYIIHQKYSSQIEYHRPNVSLYDSNTLKMRQNHNTMTPSKILSFILVFAIHAFYL